MKSVYLTISCILIAIHFSFSQINPELTYLQVQKQRIESNVKALNDSLIKINNQISNLTEKSFRNTGYKINAVLKKDATVARTSERKEMIGEFKKGDTVLLYGYEWYHYLATNGAIDGYISAGAVEETPEIKDYLKVMENREIELRKLKIKKEAIEKAEKDKIEEKTIKEEKTKIVRDRFKMLDEKTINSIINGEFWLGMTDEMAVYSIGKPKSINSNVNQYGTREQWVYDYLYLNFENGKLTSYQASR